MADDRPSDQHDDELAPLVGSDNVTGADTEASDDVEPACPHGEDVRAPVDAGADEPGTDRA